MEGAGGGRGSLCKMDVPLFRRRAAEGKDLEETGPERPEEADSQNVSANVVLEEKREEKRYLCKYYVKAVCTRGNNCTFSHNLGKFPCKLFYLKKNCRRRNCPFSHAPITAQELEALKTEGWEEKKKEEVFSPFSLGRATLSPP